MPRPVRYTQFNIMVEPDMIAQIDVRRGPLKLSRNEWVRRALRFALSRPIPTTDEDPR